MAKRTRVTSELLDKPVLIQAEFTRNLGKMEFKVSQMRVFSSLRKALSYILKEGNLSLDAANCSYVIRKKRDEYLSSHGYDIKAMKREVSKGYDYDMCKEVRVDAIEKCVAFKCVAMPEDGEAFEIPSASAVMELGDKMVVFSEFDVFEV